MLKSLALAVIQVFFAFAACADSFPKGPDENLTPGSICAHPDAIRYPEKINYCERNVSQFEKADVFQKYDQIGYRTRTMKRSSFKIDHYIPLCAGGDNSKKNLWPQHETVYKITDPLEGLICEKMAQGRLLQKDAIKIIIQGKNNLDQVPGLIQEVHKL
jgi:hypothetical protein